MAARSALIGGTRLLIGQRLWQAYSRSLDSSPVLTKGLTSMCGFVVGDLLAQATTHPRQPWDAWRTARFGIFGLAVHGPQCHLLYSLLDGTLGSSKRMSVVLMKMGIDQLLFTPVGTVIFYAAMKTLEGEAASLPTTLRDKFFPTLLAGYALWPVAHLVNFRFVSSKYRVLYINAVQVGWNVILSRIACSQTVSSRQRKEAVKQLKQEFEP